MTDKLHAQEIFDTVARHLLTQGEASMDEQEDACMYRGPRGLKCAVGCLIKDEVYSGDLELKWADDPVVLDALDRSGVAVGFNGTLLRELQDVHDGPPAKKWPERLRRVALDFGLSSAVVDATPLRLPAEE